MESISSDPMIETRNDYNINSETFVETVIKAVFARAFGRRFDS